MKNSEFRIGNYIESHINEDCKITTLNNFYLDLEPLNGEPTYNDRYTTIKGIPLTKEWLIRLDFEIQMISDHTKDDYWIHNKLPEDMSYYLPYFNMDIYIGDVSIKYVHQLQNFYFSLTGEELEIK